MIEWEYYKRRRGVRLVNLITKHDIENYAQLVDFLTNKGVKSPSEEEFKIAHKIAIPKISPSKPAAKPKAKPAVKATPKRRGRPRKTKGK